MSQQVLPKSSHRTGKNTTFTTSLSIVLMLHFHLVVNRACTHSSKTHSLQEVTGRFPQTYLTAIVAVCCSRSETFYAYRFQGTCNDGLDRDIANNLHTLAQVIQLLCAQKYPTSLSQVRFLKFYTRKSFTKFKTRVVYFSLKAWTCWLKFIIRSGGSAFTTGTIFGHFRHMFGRNLGLKCDIYIHTWRCT